MKQTEIEIAAAYPERASRLKRQGEIRAVDAEFWDDKTETFFNGTQFRLPKGEVFVNQWISNQGLKVCKKRDAVALLIVGEKKQGCFLIGKHKNYWLTSA